MMYVTMTAHGISPAKPGTRLDPAAPRGDARLWDG
jgi:hypothetical protein